VTEPIVVYPAVNLEKFWCEKPLIERKKRIVYVARFIPVKRHEIMKKLAVDLPEYEFVSVGGLIDAEKAWFEKFKENLPKNYTLKTNLPGPELLGILWDSRIYVHLMEGEHFGIAPVEGLASGCVTLVHNSGGMREFLQNIESTDITAGWESKRKQLWSKINVLTPQTFQQNIWLHLEKLFE
jgi:glycosyltransferase involved in cell wall biosynthesis